jgi:uncharacterized protein with FMN-binding domain
MRPAAPTVAAKPPGAHPTGTTQTGTSSLPPGRYTVTGDTVDTPFGPVQVRISIADSRVVDVTELQAPNSHGLSRQINQYAGPMLRQQALDAQSANIDGVSGATYTSEAYAQSLQSALASAMAGHHD